MKNTIFNTLLITLALMTMAGCPPNAEVATRVHPDGRIARMINFAYDSAAIDYALMAVPVNAESWQIKITKDSSKDETWNYQLEKTYESFQSLANDYKDTEFALDELDHFIEIKRSFRWFYTFYEYKERYAAIFPALDRDRFLSDTEWEAAMLDDPLQHPIFVGLDSAKSAEKLATIEKKQQQYLDLTAASFVIDRQLEAIKALGYYEGTIAAKQLADSLYAVGYDWGFMNDFEVDAAIFTPYFFIDSLQSIKINQWVENDSVFIKTMAGFEQASLMNYTNKIELPGTIMTTNAEWQESSTLGWKMKMENVALQDIHLYAKAKVLNTWAWVLAASIVLFSIWLWMIKR